MSKFKKIKIKNKKRENKNKNNTYKVGKRFEYQIEIKIEGVFWSNYF